MIVGILAGGKSERMGRDKPSLRWRGQTLLERAASQALETGKSVIVVGPEKPANWPLETVRFIPDISANQGPMGGLAAAFEAEPSKSILAIAADMPLVDTASIEWLIEHENANSARNGVCVRTDRGFEPLFSIYNSSCREAVNLCLKSGRRSLQRLIENADFEIVDAPTEIAAKLANVNTPDEWAQVQVVSGPLNPPSPQSLSSRLERGRKMRDSST